ncbi:MAG: hypothetical protein WKF40_05000 [Thermoleophilaceae bacterium]
MSFEKRSKRTNVERDSSKNVGNTLKRLRQRIVARSRRLERLVRIHNHIAQRTLALVQRPEHHPRVLDQTPNRNILLVELRQQLRPIHRKRLQIPKRIVQILAPATLRRLRQAPSPNPETPYASACRTH